MPCKVGSGLRIAGDVSMRRVGIDSGVEVSSWICLAESLSESLRAVDVDVMEDCEGVDNRGAMESPWSIKTSAVVVGTEYDRLRAASASASANGVGVWTSSILTDCLDRGRTRPLTLRSS